jgi:hypothetical protein
MPRCGVCGQRYGDLIIKHAYQCEDDSQALRHNPMCGDCLVPLNECYHKESVRHHRRNAGQRSKSRVVYN